MKKKLKPEERLIVAADFSRKKLGSVSAAEKKVLSLAEDLQGSGVYIKVNSILRALGYSLIEKLHNLGLKVLVDLKLVDIPKTMEYDAEMLIDYEPELVTVMCCAGIDGINIVQDVLKEKTEVLGVTVLTSFNEEECQAIFTCSTKAGVLKFARMAQLAGLGGLVLSPQESEIVKNRIELRLSLNTPGIRPEWAIVEGDDQARVMTPKKAILAGAQRIVVGRPIVQAKDPKKAVEQTLEEIRQALQVLEEEKKGGE